MDMRQPSPLAGLAKKVVDGLPGHRGSPFGEEQPGEAVVTGPKIGPDGTQFVAGDGVLDVEAAFEAADVDPGFLEVDLIPAQPDRLGDPQAMPEHEEDQQVVPLPMSATPCGQPQGLNLGLGQVVLRPLVGVDRDGR